MRWINQYIKQIAEVTAAGEATEFSYRTPIEKMLQAASAEFKVAADILQEPTRSKDIGAPDFRISAKGGGIIGYVECKTPGDNLAKRATKKQIEKYRAPASFPFPNWRLPTPRQIPKIPQEPNSYLSGNGYHPKSRQRNLFYDWESERD